MDSPDSTRGLTIDRKLRDKAYRICRKNLGGAWTRISPNEMSIAPISGGLSNMLYCCSLHESIETSHNEPTQALLRLYGGDSLKSDISMQIQIFKMLSNKDLGPKLYGDFDGGRLEEFLPAKSLTCDELINSEISSIIARKVAAVHALDVPMMDKSTSWIVDRFHEWLASINKHSKTFEFPKETRKSTIDIAQKLLAINFGDEIKFLRSVFQSTNSPLVFSHNDLHQGNILLTKPTLRRSVLEKRVILIDFEYCSYNYRAYDIANHFTEWCFEYDTPEYPHFKMFEERFPSEEVQREFIRDYLDQYRRTMLKKQYQNGATPSVLRSGMMNHSNHCSNGHDGYNINGRPIQRRFNGTNENIMTSDKEIDAIYNEVKIFCMGANLIWSLWSIKSGLLSSIKFGYWEHAMIRWKIYCQMKKEYFSGSTVMEINGNDICENK